MATMGPRGPPRPSSRGGGFRPSTVGATTVSYNVQTQRPGKPAAPKNTAQYPFVPSGNVGPLTFPNYEHNLKQLRPPKHYPFTPSRRRLVRKAFEKLDWDGKNVIEIADMAQFYNARMHPMVIAGRMKPEEVKRQVLNRFAEYSAERDGKLSVREFEEYYERVSAEIESDEHFAVMIANAWKL